MILKKIQKISLKISLKGSLKNSLKISLDIGLAAPQAAIHQFTPLLSLVTLNLAHLILYNTITNDTNILKELRLTLAIPLGLALVYMPRVTRNATSNVYSKATLIYTRRVLRRY